MTDLAAIKDAARKAAFARRKPLFENANAAQAGYLSEVLAGYRGVPLSGFMPIRTEIDPTPAMAEACAHGPVGVPVIEAAATPPKFAQWTPDTQTVSGAFGAMIPADPEFFEPEIPIVAPPGPQQGWRPAGLRRWLLRPDTGNAAGQTANHGHRLCLCRAGRRRCPARADGPAARSDSDRTGHHRYSARRLNHGVCLQV